MKPLKIKVRDTEISMPTGMLAVLVVAIISGILMLFGVVSPVEIYVWLLQAWDDVISRIKK